LTESTINGSNNNLSNDELQNYSTLEDQYCNIFENNTILNDEDIENIISVVGHAYGKPGGENIGLS
jgi:hypothetical protein